jgi:hypothetical protein
MGKPGKIDIGTILNKLDDTVDEETNEVKTYGIRYLKKKDADGKVTGEILRARKGVKNPKARMKKAGNNARGKYRYNLKENGVILLKDDDADVFRSIKAACIYGFRDYGSDVWLDRAFK